MPESRRLDPAAVAAQLRRRWTNGHRAWLDGGGTWPLAIRLGTPTERETRADLAGVRIWVESWLEAERSGPLAPSLGNGSQTPGPEATGGRASGPPGGRDARPPQAEDRRQAAPLLDDGQSPAPPRPGQMPGPSTMDGKPPEGTTSQEDAERPADEGRASGPPGGRDTRPPQAEDRRQAAPLLDDGQSPAPPRPGQMPGPSTMDGKPPEGTTSQEDAERPAESDPEPPHWATLGADASPAEPNPPAPRAELIWTERLWPGLGRQKLPERLLLPGPDALAHWIGDGARWTQAKGRARRIRDALRLPGLALGRHFDWLAEAPGPEFQRLLSTVQWLAEHPGCGLYLRQLPIPGIDTKWISANQARVTDLLRQVRGQEGDLYALSGLRREPDLLRLRILDPGLRPAVGGLSDLSAPIGEIAALPLSPAQVLIVENLQTGLALPPLPGTVVLMARGYAVEVLQAIPWLKDRTCLYWGDLDTHGFAILSRLRHSLPHARSLLMDAETLLAHRALWQQEDRPASGPLEWLAPEEQEVYLGLSQDRWGERLRLEQERIDWTYACWRIAETLAPGSHSGGGPSSSASTSTRSTRPCPMSQSDRLSASPGLHEIRHRQYPSGSGSLPRQLPPA